MSGSGDGVGGVSVFASEFKWSAMPAFELSEVIAKAVRVHVFSLIDKLRRFKTHATHTGIQAKPQIDWVMLLKIIPKSNENQKGV